MSNIIDEAVVSLGFDNSKFSSGITDTITKCKKLEDSISFKNADCLSGLEKSVKRFDISPLLNAFNLFGDKAAWAETTALNCMIRIENKFLNFATGITKALTLDPIRAGLATYETKLGAIQTIMAATGESLDYVETKINELNKYSDETIYSFSDMTQNIGKFTNAGVDLETSVAAIKGISNAAALAGANTQELSRCMYNVSQSLAMGYVQYIDWKSVENANMATKDFKKNLAAVGVEMGTVTKVNDDLYEVAGKQYSLQALFKDALKEQWLSNDVLLKTLKNYSDGETELGKKAYAAAQDIKTFSQMMDVLKESAATKWAGTFQIIIGNLEEAKKMLKQVAAPLTEMMDQAANFRNGLLSKAFTNGFEELKENIEKAGLSNDEFKEKLIRHARVEGIHIDSLIEKYEDLEGVIMAGEIDKNVISDVLDEMANSIELTSTTFDDETRRLEKFQNIVKSIKNSKWDSTYAEQKALQEKLTEAGYNYASVSELISKVVNGQTLEIKELSVAEMQNLGYTEEQIKSLTQYQLKLGTTTNKFQELLKQMGRSNVRFVWLDTLRSAFETLKNIVGSMQDAFVNVFGSKLPDTFQRCADAVHNFVTSLEINQDRAAKLTTAFSGVFKILDALFYCARSGFTFVLKIVQTLMPSLNLNFGNMANSLGEAGERFNNFVRSVHPLGEAFEWLEPKLISFKNTIGKLIDKIKGLQISNGKDLIDGIVSGLLNSKNKIANALGKFVNAVFSTMKNLFSKDTQAGGPMTIVKAILSKLKKIFTTMGEQLSKVLDGVVNFLKPSGENGRKLETAARYIDFGYILRLGVLSAAIGKLAVALIKVFNACKTFSVSATQTVGGIGTIFKKLGATIKNTNRFVKLANLTIIIEIVKSIGFFMVEVAASVLIIAAAARLLNGVSWDALNKTMVIIGTLTVILTGIILLSSELSKNAAGIKSITSLLASGALFVVTACITALAGVVLAITLMMKFDMKHTIAACIAVVILLGELFAGLILLTRATATAKTSSILALSLLVGAISTAMILISASIMLLGHMEIKDLIKGGMAVTAIMTVLVGIATAITLASPAINAALPAIAGVSVLIITISSSVLAMATACLIMNKVEWKSIAKMAMGLGLISGLAVALTVAFSAIGNVKGALASAAMIFAFSSALLLIAMGIKAIGQCSESDIAKSIIVMAALTLVFGAMLLLARGMSKTSKVVTGDYKSSSNTSSAGAGLLILAFSASLLLIAKGIQELAKVPTEDLVKGMAVITYMTVLSGALLLCAKGMGKMNKSSTASLITIAALIGVLTICCVKLGSLDAARATVGVTAIGALLVMVEGLIVLVNNSKSLVSGNGVGIIAAISGLLLTIAFSISILAKYSFADLLGALGTMTIVLTEIVVVVAILNTIAKNARDMSHLRKTVITLSVLLLAMATSIAIVEAFGDGKEAIAAAASLGITMVALAAVVMIITRLGGTGKASVVKSVIIMAAMVLLLHSIAEVYEKMSGIDCEKMASIGEALIDALGFIAGVCAACIALGATAEMALPGLGILVLALAAIAGLATLGVWLEMKFIISQKENIETVGKILKKFGEDLEPIGKICTAVDSKALDSIVSLIDIFAEVSKLKIDQSTVGNMNAIDHFVAFLPNLAKGLADFSATLSNAKFDADLVGKATNAAKVISTMYDNLPTSGGFVQKIFGENMDVDDFIKSFSPLGKAIKAFADEVCNEDIDYSLVEKAGQCASVLCELANNLPKRDGKLQEWFGETESLAAWGSNLGNFSRMLRVFAQNVRGTGETAPDYDLAEKAANMGKTIASLQEELPEKGGRLQDWFGTDMNLAEWSSNFGNFSRMLRVFAQNVRGTGETAPDYDLADQAANMGKTLASLQTHLPTTGGKLEGWFGKKMDLLTFGSNISSLGSALSSFYWSVKDIGPDHSKKCVDVLSAINTLQKEMPEDDGIFTGIFSSQMDLSKFASNLSSLGKGLSAMSEECSDVTGMDTGKMTRLCQALTALCQNTTMDDIIYIAQYDSGTLENLLPNITKIVDSGLYFADKFKNVNTTNMKAAADAISTLMNLSGGVSEADYDGFSGFITSFSNSAVDSLTAFTDGFYNSESQIYDAFDFFSTCVLKGIDDNAKSWTSAAETMLYWFNSGLTSAEQLKAVNDNGVKVGREARNGLNSEHMQWFAAGQNCVSGFIDGVKADLWHAAWIGDELGNNTLEALRKALDIHSPSRMTYQIGEYFVAGLSNGITSQYDNVTGISGELGDSLTSALEAALTDSQNMLSDVSDELRITPVVDLTNVKASAKNINSMFGTNPEISAQLSSISAYGNRNTNQYSALVKALNGLNGGETINNTYNVNGITYDDGTNVASAITSLISAANISRRV